MSASRWQQRATQGLGSQDRKQGWEWGHQLRQRQDPPELGSRGLAVRSSKAGGGEKGAGCAWAPLLRWPGAEEGLGGRTA